MVRFYARGQSAAARTMGERGPYSIEQLQALIQHGQLDADDELRREDSTVWAPLAAWAAPGAPAAATPADSQPESAPPGGRHHAGARGADSAPGALWDAVPLSDPHAVASAGRVPVSLAADDDTSPHTTRCAICLERIPIASPLCPECGEPPVASYLSPGRSPAGAVAAPLSRPQSIADDPPHAGWLRLHWRPLVTMTVIGSVLATGIALRHLAPDRYTPPRRMNPPPAAAVCDTPCWHGEACQVGSCVWQSPNDVGHVSAEPVIAGPFSLSPDVVDALPLDEERFATASLKGVGIHNARTGEVISLVSDAPQAQGLYRVGSVIYATAPSRIYVIDAMTTVVRKTIEIGSRVQELTVGASGRQVLASVPGLRAVVVISTDYHAEINRFYFGDDAVGPIAVDDAGKRALATTGHNPLPGLAPPRGGALYAFDPSRLASEQDRVRAAMVGNPSDLITTPDDETSYVVLREGNRIVPLRTLKSGAVRRDDALETCEQPEQIELIRHGRRAIVRCELGKTIEIFDLDRRKLVRHIPLNAQATDLVVSPDARQAIVALPHEGAGALGLLDLDTYELTLSELRGEPHRVRLTPDGRTAVVISDRAKAAWVVR